LKYFLAITIAFTGIYTPSIERSEVAHSFQSPFTVSLSQNLKGRSLEIRIQNAFEVEWRSSIKKKIAKATFYVVYVCEPKSITWKKAKVPYFLSQQGLTCDSVPHIESVTSLSTSNLFEQKTNKKDDFDKFGRLNLAVFLDKKQVQSQELLEIA
jgi:hypothetical protein